MCLVPSIYMKHKVQPFFLVLKHCTLTNWMMRVVLKLIWYVPFVWYYITRLLSEQTDPTKKEMHPIYLLISSNHSTKVY